jgi:hypothetical protein
MHPLPDPTRIVGRLPVAPGHPDLPVERQTGPVGRPFGPAGRCNRVVQGFDRAARGSSGFGWSARPCGRRSGVADSPRSGARRRPRIETRFRALVKLIKANPNYNAAIGEALGIEGREQSAPDLSTIQPDITATASGGAVVVGWGGSVSRACRRDQ